MPGAFDVAERAAFDLDGQPTSQDVSGHFRVGGHDHFGGGVQWHEAEDGGAFAAHQLGRDRDLLSGAVADLDQARRGRSGLQRRLGRPAPGVVDDHIDRATGPAFWKVEARSVPVPSRTVASAPIARASSNYNHFTSKLELLEALLADLQADVDAELAEHPPDHDLSDPAMLRTHVAAFWTTFRSHLPEMIALHQASMVEQAVATQLRALLAPEREVMIAHMRLLQSKGIDLPGRPELVASAMIGMMWQFAHEHVATGDENLPDGEAIDLLTAFILRGIAGTAPRQ